MWDSVVEQLVAFAPYLRPAGLALIVFAFIAVPISRQRIGNLGAILGSLVCSGSVILGGIVWLLWADGKATAIGGSYGNDGILVIYGIVWPILMMIFGISIWDVSRDPDGARK